jgi:hypothetical protein
MQILLRAVVVAGIWAFGSCCARAEETYCRVVQGNGRVVYTNIAEQVPVEQRERARLDLSRVSLNSEIGRELDQRFAQEHAELTQSDYCKELRGAAGQGFWQRLWSDFGPLLVCGAVLLGFLLFTPSAMRRYGAPVWAKTLMMAVPSLAVAGLLMFTMGHTNKTLGEIRQQLRPCTAETFENLKSSPNPIQKHAELIEQLKREIAKIDAEAPR